MGSRFLEFMVGLIILIASLGFFVFSLYALDKVNKVNTSYTLKARFSNVGSLQSGNVVKINGIAVGSVRKVELEKNTYKIMVSMDINDLYHFDNNSTVAIKINNFIGDVYVSISPVLGSDSMKDGEEFKKTVDYSSIEDRVLNFVSNSLK